MNTINRADITAEDFTEAPTPDESGVRLSSRPPIEEARERVAGLLGGRFLRMHQLSAATHIQFGLMSYNTYGSVKSARFPTALQVASTFSDEELKLVEDYQKPALLLTPPGRTSEDLFDCIASHYSGRQSNPFIQNADELNFAPEEDYRAYIVEGASRMMPHSFDRLSLPIEERMNLRRQNAHPVEWGMTKDLYALLAMQSVIRRSPIDERTFTFLDSESMVAGRYHPIGHTKLVKSADGEMMRYPGTLDWQPEERLQSSRGRFRRVLGARSPIELEAA